jgi:hypothetical protein
VLSLHADFLGRPGSRTILRPIVSAPVAQALPTSERRQYYYKILVRRALEKYCREILPGLLYSTSVASGYLTISHQVYTSEVYSSNSYISSRVLSLLWPSINASKLPSYTHRFHLFFKPRDKYTHIQPPCHCSKTI